MYYNTKIPNILNATNKIKKWVTKHAWVDFLLLAFVSFGVYGFWNITKLGIISDDWFTLKEYYFAPDKSLLGLLRYDISVEFGNIYRITLFFFYPLVNYIGFVIKNRILAFNLMSLVVNFALLAILYILLRKLTKLRLESLLIAIFSWSFIGRSSTFFWAATYIQTASITLMLLAVYICLTDVNKALKALLIFFCTALSLWSYETTMLTPLVIYVACVLKTRKWRPSAETISSALGIATIVFFKLYMYPKLLHQEVIKRVPTENMTLHMLVDRMHNLIETSYRVFITPGLFEFWKHFFGSATLILTAVTLALIVYELVKSLHTKNVKEYEAGDALKRAMFLGAAILVAFGIGVSPIMGGLDYPTLYGVNNRTMLMPSLAAGIIMATAILYLRAYSSKAAYALFLVILFANLACLQEERVSYIRTWNLEQEAYRNLEGLLKTQQLPKGEIFYAVILNRKYTGDHIDLPVISQFWTITHMIMLIANNSDCEARIYNSVADIKVENGKVMGNDWGWRKYYDTQHVYIVDTVDKTFYEYPNDLLKYSENVYNNKEY